MKLVAVAPVTANTVREAMTVGLRYGLSHWDSQDAGLPFNARTHALRQIKQGHHLAGGH